MILSLKRTVREMQAKGQMPFLTNLLRKTWQSYKNARDYLNIRDLPQLLEQDPGTPEGRVKMVMEGAGGAIAPIQVPQEITRLVELVEHRKPRVILEIGTAKGGSLCLLCRSAPEDATIISLDLPYGRNGGGYPKWKVRYYEQFKKPGQTLHLLRGNSHDPTSMEQVRKILDGRTLDFIFIDGDHSYEGVKTDFELYAPLLTSGGVIALHDILQNRFDPSIDVNRFWEELPEPKTEIVANYDQGNAGIGVVSLDGGRQVQV